MDFPPILASYYDDNYGNKSFIDVVFDDPDYHLKIMYQLIHQNLNKHKKQQITPISYPITPFEVSQMPVVVQPIIPIIRPVLPQQTENTILMNVVGNVGVRVDIKTPVKRGRPEKTSKEQKKITDAEALMRRRELARESARRCRKKKRDLAEEAKKKLKMLREKNKSLLSELEKLKNENPTNQ
jgi:hypothetical protein